MNAYHNSNSKKLIHRPLQLPQLQSIFKRILNILTHYDTPKVVRFQSKWIASLSLVVKLTLVVVCVYLMCQRSSYQVFDRSPISAVIIKVKLSFNCSRNSSIMRHFPNYNCSQSIYDINDFISPATENSAVSITTRITETEHVLRDCNNAIIRKTANNKFSSTNAIARHNCVNKSQCLVPPFYRHQYENNTKIIPKTPLCWFKLPKKDDITNYQALDYILFIENFVEFPQLDFRRNNRIRDIFGDDYMENCEYDPKNHPLCPNFRILKILKIIENDTQEYEQMFYNGSLIEIQISWECNHDHKLKYCQPHYKFQRLDFKPYRDNPFQLGSTFHTSRHFFQPNDSQLHRVHTNLYNLHILVSVTGEVGKRDLFQTTTSIGSYIAIIGAGTIVCDLIAAFFTNFRSVKYDS